MSQRINDGTREIIVSRRVGVADVEVNLKDAELTPNTATGTQTLSIDRINGADINLTTYSVDYIKSLEARIKYLEDQLAAQTLVTVG